jgi:hypothetical protein
MNNQVLSYFPSYFSNRAIFIYVVALLICSVLFFSNILPFIWIFFGLFEVVTFFVFLTYFTKKWINLSEERFRKKLFWTSLIIRSVYVVFSFYFYFAMTGTHFEFQAADSVLYHSKAVAIVNNGFISTSKAWLLEGYSDTGFNIFLALIYMISGKSILVSRLIFAVFSAWGSLFVYRMGSRNFGITAGRIGAILYMLIPNIIYYCGLTLKEEIMVFLLVAFMERADSLIHSGKINFPKIIIVVLLGTSLFFFRTVLAAAAFFALFSAFIFQRNRKIWINRIWLSVWVILLGGYLYSGKIEQEVEMTWNSRTNQQEQNLNFKSTRKGGNEFAKYGSTLVFAPLSISAPFPTLVYVDTTLNENVLYLNGAYYTRNVYSFFVLLSIFVLLKSKLIRDHILILSFLLAYLLILSMSSYAISERFQLPAVPFLLILSGYGVTLVNRRNIRYYFPYILLMAVIIVGWNWFKLAGRGLV